MSGSGIGITVGVIDEEATPGVGGRRRLVGEYLLGVSVEEVDVSTGGRYGLLPRISVKV